MAITQFAYPLRAFLSQDAPRSVGVTALDSRSSTSGTTTVLPRIPVPASLGWCLSGSDEGLGSFLASSLDGIFGSGVLPIRPMALRSPRTEPALIFSHTPSHGPVPGRGNVVMGRLAHTDMPTIRAIQAGTA